MGSKRPFSPQLIEFYSSFQFCRMPNPNHNSTRVQKFEMVYTPAPPPPQKNL